MIFDRSLVRIDRPTGCAMYILVSMGLPHPEKLGIISFMFICIFYASHYVLKPLLSPHIFEWSLLTSKILFEWSCDACVQVLTSY